VHHSVPIRITGRGHLQSGGERMAKNRLDEFGLNQEVIFNYKADLAGTGNRSIIN